MNNQPNIKHSTGAGGRIRAIRPASIADELGLQPGDLLVSIGGHHLRDVIDYRFLIAEEQIDVLVRHVNNEEIIYEIEKDPDEDLGIDFEEPLFDRLRTCTNKCPFCFLTQMPRGFRKSLYLKDDDYRLSFIYSNFVTFTNLHESDWERIAAQHLSPLHISVHATDPAWRAIMLGKRDVPDVRAQIRRLHQIGVTVHTQIVACPGVNDGPILQQSINDLIALAPTVQSIAVVPVGLTKYRFEGQRPRSIRAAIEVHESPEWHDSNAEPQPLWQTHESHPPLHDPSLGFCSRLAAASEIPLRCYTPDEASAVLDLIHSYSATCRRDFGMTLVYPSDEFYILAGREIPPADFYDDMPQYSNGVGMVRDFLDTWAKAKRRLPPRMSTPTRLALVCGTLVGPLLQQVATRLNTITGLDVQVLPVVNEFFGATVTVSGLLAAQDVIPALQASGAQHAILPRVMFDYQGDRTIDDQTPQHISEAAAMSVSLANDPTELVRSVRTLAQR
ncbi:DUF512 domain-containing protein [Candidatus Oscillochloris fontis]|uniref:DUF512 domain-containing protein n=1 Tax=Candidatus Oscillochloris fontis TaxID=2496868 RepID=UPI00101C6C96|nr:DUF512 domain-containing protein [Candidatus Oscillochloris fontis]